MANVATPYGVSSIIGIYDGTNFPTVTLDPIGGSGAVSMDIQAVKADFESDATIIDLNDPNGQPQGFSKVRGTRKASFEFVARSRTTPTVAEAVAATKPPKDMQVITLANFVKQSDALLNGDWVYKTGAKVSFTDEGEAKITMEMMQYFNGAGTLIPAATLLAAVS